MHSLPSAASLTACKSPSPYEWRCRRSRRGARGGARGGKRNGGADRPDLAPGPLPAHEHTRHRPVGTIAGGRNPIRPAGSSPRHPNHLASGPLAPRALTTARTQEASAFFYSAFSSAFSSALGAGGGGVGAAAASPYANLASSNTSLNFFAFSELAKRMASRERSSFSSE